MVEMEKKNWKSADADNLKCYKGLFNSVVLYYNGLLIEIWLINMNDKNHTLFVAATLTTKNMLAETLATFSMSDIKRGCGWG